MKIRDVNVIRKENKEMKNQKDNSVKTGIILSLLFLLVLFLIGFGKQTLIWSISSIPVKQTPVVVIDSLKEAIKLVDLKYTWEIINFEKEKTLYLNLAVTNNSEKTFKNLEVVCTPTYESPVITKLKVTIFDIFKSHTTKNILQYNFGKITNDAKKVDCEIVNLIID